ncbi:SRPBCC family protein [Bacillus sp. EAC]|uniref:SRPBCC family protein n=1 Tax=Bacillus sp. EAC TaxID=1978338 RepID=UPI00115520EB|nr:SRPBCC family protein [Bacillus sp. EAC]
MKKSNYSIIINAPIGAVFEVVDSDDHVKNWLEGFIENIYEGDFDRENPVGKKFKQRLKEGNKIQEYNGEILSYKRPKELGLRLMHSSFTVDVYYRFSSVEKNQTRLDYECKLVLHSFLARSMGFIFNWFSKRMLSKQMAELKKYAEARFDGVI